MITHHNEHVAYEVAFPADASETTQTIWNRLLGALRTAHPTASLPDQDGFCEATAHDGTLIRYGHDAASGFWTVEVFAAATGNHWSAYLMPMPDETWRTGWLRSGSREGMEPSCWLDVVSHLQLGAQAQPNQPPSFMALISAMSSVRTLPFAQVDQHTIDALTSELDEQRRVIHDQAVALRVLRLSLSSQSNESSATTANRSWTMEDIGEWAAENADRIVVMPRAISEAKKSPYEDPALVYEALAMLADIYPKVRTGELPRDALINRCNELNLFIGGSVDPSQAGMAGDEYFVRWRGRRRFLEQHLGRGSSRDPRRTMRIYFFYDEDHKHVVCGHLPSHLSNSKS